MQNVPTLRIESPRLFMAIQNPTSPHRQEIDGWDVSETYLQESAEGAPSGVGSYRIIFETHPTTSDEALNLYEAGVELAELLEKLWIYVATTPLSGPRFMLVLVPLAPPKSWVTNYEDVYRDLTARESGIHFGRFEMCPRFWSYPLDFPLRDILTVREKYLTADEATKTLIDLHFNAHLASGLHAGEGDIMPNHADIQHIHGYCGLCRAACGTVATVDNGRFIRLDPDPLHPTGQALCTKGRAAPELVYHPERLTHPLRRTRPKGEGDPGWERISWDTALDLTAAAMRRIVAQHGPEAVAFSLSSPSTTAIGDSVGFIQRLMHAFGTPNCFNNMDMCGWGRAGATRYVYGVGSVATGGAGSGAMPDIAQSGCLILWGYNPSSSRLTHATATVAARKRGMRLIVIDPRRAGFVSKADIWLRVRPGTDGALALGLANLMIQHGWYDADFMRTWSNGPLLVRADTGRMLTVRDLTSDGQARQYLAWDTAAARPVVYDVSTGRYNGATTTLALDGEYRIATAQGEVVCQPAFALYAALCRRYPPEVMETTCWIPRAQLEETAQLLWRARPVSYYAWSGHEHHANVTQTARAMALLYALTGCFDAPGGNVLLPSVPTAPITGADLPVSKQRPPALGAAERPLGPSRSNVITARELYRAILDGTPYPVHGLIGFGANMLLSQADGRHGRVALAALDFYAYADLFMTPTAALADVVLPVASAFEREALKIGFEVSTEAQSLIQFRQAIVPPPGEARADTDIVFALAERLGLGAQFWNGDIETAYSHQLAPSGVSLEQLRAQPAGVRVPLHVRYAKHAEPDVHGHPRGFATPSRRIELYSETFLEHGYAPLPDFVEPAIGPVARPDLAARFPLVLTCAKPGLFCQSQHRALPSLRKRVPDPTVALHPETARARQIAQGDWVSIATPAGSVRARAQLNRTSIRAWWWANTAGGRAALHSVHRPTIRLARRAPISTCSSAATRLTPSVARPRIVPICARFDLLQKQKGQEVYDVVRD